MPYFETDLAKFHYYEYGSGDQIMLAFHGFGMRGTQFEVLAQAFGSAYTVYSFDLFFHGDTILSDTSTAIIRKGLMPEVFSKQMEAFLRSKGYDERKYVSLLSYSIGARCAWSLIASMPQRIGQAYFIAPDGIEPNKLLAFGAGNLVVNRVFHRLVYSPGTVKFVLNNLYRFGYIDSSLHRILDYEFSTEDYRQICYNTITFYNSLLFKKKLADLINKYKIDCHFYFGKRDKLFPSSIGERFARLLNKPEMHIFEEGHELVNTSLNDYLIRQFHSNND